MTKDQNIKFLVGLGIERSKAETMSKSIPDGATATPETEVDEAFQSAVSHQNELYRNGDEYKTALKEKHDQAMKEIRSKSEKKIITIASLTPEEVKDKKYDDIVDLAWSKAAKMGDKTSEELQAELIKKDNRLKELEEVEIPKIKSEVETEKLNFKIRSGAIHQISKLKLSKGMDVEDAFILFEQKAKRAGYIASVNEKGEFIVTNTDGSKIMTEDKKGMLDAQAVLTNLLDGMIDKSAAPAGDNKTTIIHNEEKKEERPKNGIVVNDNIAKAKAHAEKLKTKTT